MISVRKIYLEIAKRDRRRILKSRRRDSEKKRFNALKWLERCDLNAL